MISIAICDDQSMYLEKIEKAISEYFINFPEYQVRVSGFCNSSVFLDELEKTGGWDIVILDICMPGISGTEIAREIRRRHDRTEIIFISVSSDYALAAFALKAVHYVLKPFSSAEFHEALSRALLPFSDRKPRRILLHLASGSIQSIDASSILYIESIAYRRVVHTSKGVFEETRRTLSSFLEELGDLFPGQFIQPYRGYIVNLEAIRTISPDHITLQSGDSVPIKRGDFRKLRESYFKWSFRDEGADVL